MKIKTLFSIIIIFVLLLFSGKYIAICSNNQEGNCLLKDLSVANGTMAPNFDENTNTYNVVVKNQYSELKLSMHTLDPKASISITGADNLIAGQQNKVTIIVTSQKVSQTYILWVFREIGLTNPLNNSCLLNSLIINGGKIPLVFSPNQFYYQLTAPNGIKTINVNALANNNSDIINIYGENELLNNQSCIINVTVSDNNGGYSIYTLSISKNNTINTEFSSIILIVLSLLSILIGIIGTLIFLYFVTSPNKSLK